MEKLKMQSKNKIDENIKKIGELFPNCVTEVVRDGAIELGVDFDMLKQVLSSVAIDGNEERYQFTWPDKKKSVLLANAPINKTLRPCREESVDFENTKNLYIEGDNLDVLKLLQETYMGKVDVIYIDPPYNTGTSLIYHNDFFQSANEYLVYSGQYDDEGYQVVENTENNGRFHTDWLNMIYPRLCVAKDLLKDTGILVLTIDDYEINTVTTVLNEIFGENNHLGTVIIKNNPSGRSTVKGFSINHEYALFYSKTDNATLGRMQHNDVQKARYKEKDSQGFFEWENFRKNGTDSDRADRPKQFYPIVIDINSSRLRIPMVEWNDETKTYSLLEEISDNEQILYPITPVGIEKVWKYGIERAKMLVNEFLVKESASNYEIYRKKHINENGSLPRTWWDKPEYSARDNGTRTLSNIFGPQKMFDFPKAPEAVRDALQAANLTKNGLVLDFFSGSATTAHAVMQLNSEDGGNRKFICVQLPEETEEKSEARKAGYKNICEIGKERIRRTGNIIKNDSPLTTQELDTGFRVLKLDTTNMKEVYYHPDMYNQDLFDELEGNIKPDRTPQDLLFQVMLDMGIILDSKITEETVEGKKMYVVGEFNGLVPPSLVACFDANLTDEVVTQIAKLQPLYAVFRDSSFANDSVATNFDQIFDTYSTGTIRKVI